MPRDTRGVAPFVPLRHPAAPSQRRSACPQLPTTLPTLDELIGVDGIEAEQRARGAAGAHAHALRRGHVFTLHAELEGMKLLPVLRRLLAGWRAQGYQLVSMRTLFAALDVAQPAGGPRAPGAVPGRSGVLAVQAAGRTVLISFPIPDRRFQAAVPWMTATVHAGQGVSGARRRRWPILLRDGMSVSCRGGFGLCGIPEHLIDGAARAAASRT